MVLSLRSNIASQRAQSQLLLTSNQLGRTLERLSSGQRINNASDDAAGLAIADSLKADSRVALQGVRNLNDGISLLNIYEGALTELRNILTRQKELSEQSANGVNTTAQRQALNSEASALSSEYNRIIVSISFNGLNLGEVPSRLLVLQAGSSQVQGSIAEDIARNVGDGTYAQGVTYAGSAAIHTSLQGDFNGDGLPDIVTQSGLNTIRVYLNNGQGGYGAAIQTVAGLTEVAISVGDFNNDGLDDILALDQVVGGVNLLLSNGSGGFTVSNVTVPSGTTYSGSAVVGDFNGDGNLDFFASESLSGYHRFYYGDGNGSFSAGATIGILVSSPAVTVGDFNGDGYDDLVKTGAGGNLNVFYGSASGINTTSVNFHPGTAISGLLAQDLNNDGYEDIITFSNNGNYTISYGSASGTFTTTATSNMFASASTIRNAHIADVNGDGIPDLVGFTTTGHAHVNFGKADGTFSQAAVSTALTYTSSSIVADINNNDVPDFITFNNSNGNFSVHTGNTTKTTSTKILNLNTRQGSLEALDFLSSALDRINSETGQTGAFRSRLDIAVNNLQTSAENFKAAESRIRDADIATETANMVRMQILQQTGVAVLAQANIQPEILLRLLSFEK